MCWGVHSIVFYWRTFYMAIEICWASCFADQIYCMTKPIFGFQFEKYLMSGAISRLLWYISVCTLHVWYIRIIFYYNQKQRGFLVTDAVKTQKKRKTRKKIQVQKAKKKLAYIMKFLGGWKWVGVVITHQISKECGLSYAGAKKICTNLKSSENCHDCSVGLSQKVNEVTA